MNQWMAFLHFVLPKSPILFNFYSQLLPTKPTGINGRKAQVHRHSPDTVVPNPTADL